MVLNFRKLYYFFNIAIEKTECFDFFLDNGMGSFGFGRAPIGL